MGIGDWGLGIGDWGLGPIPNPQLKKNILNKDYKIIKIIILYFLIILIFIYFQIIILEYLFNYFFQYS